MKAGPRPRSPSPSATARSTATRTAERGHDLVKVWARELEHLLNAMDPSPLHERDLAPNAEEFIVGSAMELPRAAEISLLIHLDRPKDLARDHAILESAIRTSFAQRAETSRRRLRQLFRRGRTSLLIAIAFLAGLTAAGDLVAEAMPGRRLGELLREGFLIGGWVAMWRPLEIFLYDWWPIRAEAQLYDRLRAMPVRIAPREHAAPPA